MLRIQLDTTKLFVDDRFINPGYEISTKEGKNAVKVFVHL